MIEQQLTDVLLDDVGVPALLDPSGDIAEVARYGDAASAIRVLAWLDDPYVALSYGGLIAGSLQKYLAEAREFLLAAGLRDVEGQWDAVPVQRRLMVPVVSGQAV